MCGMMAARLYRGGALCDNGYDTVFELEMIVFISLYSSFCLLVLLVVAVGFGVWGLFGFSVKFFRNLHS